MKFIVLTAAMLAFAGAASAQCAGAKAQTPVVAPPVVGS